MTRTRLPFRPSPLHVAFLAAAAPLAAAQAPVDSPDEAPRVLARFAEAAMPTIAAGVALEPRVLFRVAANANAYAIAGGPDGNVDGVPDIAVGLGIGASGPNLSLWSGGGFGNGKRLWGVTTTDGISGGYFGDIDQITAFPDVDGDGIGEVLAGTWGGGRAATLYSGANGTVLQSFSTYLGPASGWVYAVTPIGDITGDGVEDFALATGSNADAVFAVSGALTGTHHTYVWKVPTGDVSYSLARVSDVDGDGHRDLAVGVGDTKRDVLLLSARTGGEIWRRTLSGSVQHVAPFPDVDGDGIDEVLAACWSASGSVVLLDGATGTPRWTSAAAGGNALRAIALRGDANGDGVPDVVVASFQSVARVLSGANGASLWTAQGTGGVWAVEALDDFDGDGVGEVAFGAFDGFARLASGATGDVLWTHAAAGKKVMAVTALGDLDGDGHPEVLFGAQQLASATEPMVHLLAARTGNVGIGLELFAPTIAPIGQDLVLDVLGPPVDLAAVFVLGSGPCLVPLPGFGTLAVFPPTVFPGAAFVPQGAASLQLPVPANPALVGITAYLQTFAVALVPGAPWASSNRVGFVVGP